MSLVESLTFRPATMADEAAVGAISAQIWDGEDYVPETFADWVADSIGAFTLAFAGPELAGFSKLTELGPGEWWLEGLRVAPAFRGQGVARALHFRGVELADELGWGTLRFATSAKNLPIHHLAAESGFHYVNEHALADCPAGGPLPPTLQPIAPAEYERWRDQLLKSPQFAALGGLMEDTWQWLEIERRLPSLLAERRLYWWRDAGLVIVHELPDEPFMWVNYVDAPTAEWPALFAALPALAAALGLPRVKMKPPAEPAWRDALSAAGWEVEEGVLRLYARPLLRRAPESDSGE
jgi:GNAT superfamily N-acetyltransferase